MRKSNAFVGELIEMGRSYGLPAQGVDTRIPMIIGVDEQYIRFITFLCLKSKANHQSEQSDDSCSVHAMDN